MKIFWTILFVILATGIYAQNPAVSSPIKIDTLPNGDMLLSIPRHKGFYNPATHRLFLLPAQNKSWLPAWYYSDDYGTSWHGVTGYFEDDAFTDMHVSFYFADAIHGGATDGTPYYKRVRLPCTAISDTVQRVNLSTYPITFYENVIATDSLNAWVIYRQSTATENVRYKHTTDGWSTLDSGYVLHINRIGSSVRVGMATDGTIIDAVILVDFGTSSDGFYYAKWNGSGWDSLSDAAIITGTAYSTNDRSFAIGIADSKLHLIFGHGNYLIHARQNGSGTWLYDTVSTSTYTEDVLWYPTLGVRGKAINVIYRVQASATLDAENNLCYKRWTPTAGWDADSTVIVENTDIKYSQTPPIMDDSIPWIPVWWSQNTYGGLYYARILFDSVPPPEVTQSLSNIYHDTVQITLQDVYTGTVNPTNLRIYYDTDSTFGSPAYIDSAPNVSPDTVNISGLTPGTGYWLKAVMTDENGSHTSDSVKYITDVSVSLKRTRWIGRVLK